MLEMCFDRTMALLLCGFGGFLFPQLVKTLFRRPLVNWVKLILALLASMGIAAALYAPHHITDLLVYGFAGAGLAVLIHRIARLASVAGDHQITQIIQSGGRRR